MAYNRASDTYFENQVFTATPQRLRLMLIDGALHYARRALEHWQSGRAYEGGEAVIGCQRIVTELLRSLRPEIAPELVSNVAAIYNFVFRSLIDAGLKRDQAKLRDAISVLEIERETWRQVCEQLGSTLDTTPQPRANLVPHFAIPQDVSTGGFAIDA
ncbi:MAG TPA: flagellar export chaperone FliS [Pirellulales bacterium]|nr:flagellar export chaperone FliS [Pirellulales bacterium]